MNTQALPTLGEMADQYYEARAARLVAQKEVDGLKAKETVAEQILINYLKAQGLEGAKGHVATAAIKRTKTVMVERDEDGNDVGKESFIEFLLDTRDASLLQFRPSLTRVKELVEEGVDVPGVKLIEVESISLTKVSKKA